MQEQIKGRSYDIDKGATRWWKSVGAGWLYERKRVAEEELWQAIIQNGRVSSYLFAVAKSNVTDHATDGDKNVWIF